jgi:hypothetical protein
LLLSQFLLFTLYMPKGVRAKENRTITVSLPKTLVAEIDQLARAERRSRSNWIVIRLEDLVKKRSAGDKIADFKPGPAIPHHHPRKIYK